MVHFHSLDLRSVPNFFITLGFSLLLIGAGIFIYHYVGLTNHISDIQEESIKARYSSKSSFVELNASKNILFAKHEKIVNKINKGLPLSEEDLIFLQNEKAELIKLETGLDIWIIENQKNNELLESKDQLFQNNLFFHPIIAVFAGCLMLFGELFFLIGLDRKLEEDKIKKHLGKVENEQQTT